MRERGVRSDAVVDTTQSRIDRECEKEKGERGCYFFF